MPGYKNNRFFSAEFCGHFITLYIFHRNHINAKYTYIRLTLHLPKITGSEDTSKSPRKKWQRLGPDVGGSGKDAAGTSTAHTGGPG